MKSTPAAFFIMLLVCAAASVGAESPVFLNANQMSIATGQPSLVLMSNGPTHIPVWSLSGGTVGQSVTGLVTGLPGGCRAVKIEIVVTTTDATTSAEFEDVYRVHMEFLHKGRPPVVRQAVFNPAETKPLSGDAQSSGVNANFAGDLLKILASPNVASKESIVRQYDHEVQGSSAVKAFVGVANDGPSDAAVIRPVLGSRRGVVIACGMNPRYGDFDTYHMAASAIDEAIRNCVAVGADPSRIALLDNFCWGDCERAETLGSLVRASLACYDLAVALGTPFISGKDSLNNEFSYTDGSGQRQTIAIPPSLLISAMGQVADVSRCVTMDLKRAGNLLYLVGETRDELGGSHYAFVHGLTGGQVPTVNVEKARDIFAAVHRAISGGLVRACHDLSEGGLAVAAAEMAFAGGLAAKIDVAAVPVGESSLSARGRLFSESNSRFVCEVEADRAAEFEKQLGGVAFAKVGQVTADARLVLNDGAAGLIDADISELKEAWQATLRY